MRVYKAVRTEELPSAKVFRNKVHEVGNRESLRYVPVDGSRLEYTYYLVALPRHKASCQLHLQLHVSLEIIHCHVRTEKVVILPPVEQAPRQPSRLN